MKSILILLALAACLVSAAACDTRNGPGVYDGVIEFDQRFLGFIVGGKIADIRIERGDAVRAGQVLATLDDSLLRVERPMLDAQLAQAAAQFEAVVAGPRAAEIKAVADKLTAANAQVREVQRELRRQRPLVAEGALPEKVIDDLESKLEQAEATRDSIAEQLSILEEGSRQEEVVAARAARDAAQAQLAALDERLFHYHLRAPADGRILDVTAKTGEVVQPGTPVVLFAEPTIPYVDVFVPTPELPGITVGVPAHVTPDGDTREYPAEVEYVSPTTEYTPHYLMSEDDRAALVTRVRVRIDDSEERLHAGVPCKVRITLPDDHPAKQKGWAPLRDRIKERLRKRKSDSQK